MTPTVEPLMLMRWLWTGGTVRMLGLTRSYLMSNILVPNVYFVLSNVAVVFETSSINIEIRK